MTVGRGLAPADIVGVTCGRLPNSIKKATVPMCNVLSGEIIAGCSIIAPQ